MPGIEFSFSSSTILIVALACISVVAGFLFYRYTLPPIAPSWRLTLSVLRGTSLALIVLLFFEPAVRFVISKFHEPVLSVLVDNSQSMLIADRRGERREQVEKTLARFPNGAMVGNSRIKHVYFAEGILDKPEDSLLYRGDATDIGRAIRQIVSERERENIVSILLVSDGIYTIGYNPVYDAEKLGIPIFPLGVGDSSEQKDILIRKVAANEIVYNESDAPVDVVVKSAGYGGERVEVTLADGNRVISRQELPLERGVREYPVRLVYVPQGEGTKKYTIAVTSLEGELTTKNNTKTLFVRVLKNRLRTLLLVGSPSPDGAALHQVLREDRSMSTVVRTHRSDGSFYEGQLTSALLDSTDCIITIGFPTASTSQATLALLSTATLRNAKPILFVDGSGVVYSKLASYSSILPFTIGEIRETEAFVFPSIVPNQRTNPVVDLTMIDNREWDRLPPLFRKRVVYRAKTEATVLATLRDQSVVLPDPFILARSVQSHKSVAVLGYGLWRWRLMTRDNSETSQVLATFVANSVRWLTTREENRPVRITTDKNSYLQNQPVEFQAQVYDGSSRPVIDARVEVVIAEGDRKFNLLLIPIGNGRYHGRIASLGPGTYAFRGTAVSNGTSYGSDKGSFAIGEMSLEFQETRMNSSLLRQLAERTGGTFYHADNIDNLREELARSPGGDVIKTTSANTIELWNWQYFLFAIIFLLSVEWFLRKRHGML